MYFLCAHKHKTALEKLIALSGNSFKGNLEFIEELAYLWEYYWSEIENCPLLVEIRGCKWRLSNKTAGDWTNNSCFFSCNRDSIKGVLPWMELWQYTPEPKIIFLC